MRKNVQSQYKTTKSQFLRHNWYLQKLCYMFIPVVVPFIGAIMIIYCIILAIKSFCKTLKCELNNVWDVINDGEYYNIFTLWYIGWRFWNQKNAADYLHGLDDE